MPDPKKDNIKISDLIPDDRNYNLGNAFGNSLIEKSLRNLGAGRSILLDKNNKIIAGNKTVENAASIGLEDVQIVESDGKRIIAVKHMDIDLDSKQGREMALADNATAKANIEWNLPALTEDWEAEELTSWGITDFEQAPEAVEDDYIIPDEIVTDIVLGDLFTIGSHRLLCGDALNTDNILKVLNGKKPDMVYADAPYGIEIVQNNSVGGGGPTKFGGVRGKVVDSTKTFEKVIGDETTGTAKDFYEVCKGMGFKNLILWGGNYFTDFLPITRCWFVWDKEMTGNFSEAEMAWTSFEKGGIRVFKYLWNGLSREGSRELEGIKRMHPTQKPVGLAMMIFQRFDFLKIIFDGFLGSGTTMVAAHQLNRKCYGIEIDPKYVQVIIDRMLKLDSTLPITKNGQPWERPDQNNSEKTVSNGK